MSQMMLEPSSAPLVSQEGSPPRLSILICSFNTREMTLECVRSVRRETKVVSYEIIVIDNQSSDGSADAIEAEFPDVRLIRAEGNLGFARANNVAATHAKGELLLLLNPDTVVIDGAIDRLVSFADSQPQAKIWGGRTLFGDRTLNPASCWACMSLWTLFCSTLGLTVIFPNSEIFNHECYGRWKRDRVRKVDIVTGCLLLIPTRFWLDIGGFDPKYFMYGEEADLCIRARARGARPMVTPQATIIHYGSASDPIQAVKRIGVLKAKLTLIRQHWPPLRRWLGELLFILSAVMRFLAYSLMARFRGGEKTRKRAELWREVWRQRRLWLSGYTDGGHP
jgi:GT2 family glycosyltransferase